MTDRTNRDRDFIYIFQSPATIYRRDRDIRVLEVSWDLHIFIRAYAKAFAKVEIPMPTEKSEYISAANTRKIGKAMITHQETPGWNASYERRSEIIGKLKQPHEPIHLLNVWRLRELFLHGGRLEILGYQESYIDPPDNERDTEVNYTIITHTDDPAIERIRENARIIARIAADIGA